MLAASYSLDHLFDVDDEFAKQINESYATSLRDSIYPYLNNPRGGTDWFLTNRLFNSVIYFMQMFEDSFDALLPYLSSGVLDLLFRVTSLQTMPDNSFYSMLYGNINSTLTTYSSTRSDNIRAYTLKQKIQNEDTTNFIFEELSSGELMARGYLDKVKLHRYFDAMRERGQFSAWYSLRSVYAMERFLKILRKEAKINEKNYVSIRDKARSN